MKDSSGNGARRVRLFKSRILHLTAEAIAQRAVEAVALTVDELVLDVGLIEKDEVDDARSRSATWTLTSSMPLRMRESWGLEITIASKQAGIPGSDLR